MDLWSTLGLATAVLPVQVAITVLLLRSPRGVARAGAWVAGMTLVRLLQFGVFGMMLERVMDDGEAGPSPVEGALLLMVAVFLLGSAARKMLRYPDEDVPPPRWMAAVDGMAASRAFLMGAGLVALSPKLWAFTLGAIGAIGEAHVVGLEAWVVFVVWMAVAQAPHLLAVGAMALAPAWATPRLVPLGEGLERHSRTVMIGVGLVFGAWFLLKALRAFGVI